MRHTILFWRDNQDYLKVRNRNVHAQGAIDSKRSFLGMQQKREFWLFGLTEINRIKNHRLGESGRLHFSERSASMFIQT